MKGAATRDLIQGFWITRDVLCAKLRFEHRMHKNRNGTGLDTKNIS